MAAEAPTSPGGGSHESGEQSPRSNSNVREQDRYLPIANVSRIMKKALPANGKIAKDAKETVQECVSEFISFITSEWRVTPRDQQRVEMLPLQRMSHLVQLLRACRFLIKAHSHKALITQFSNPSPASDGS